MDTVFLLSTETRAKFLQRAARLIGCAYICLWSPLHHISSNCVPGWAFKERLLYFELRDSSLMSSASLQVQQQFYQEFGIKTAVFMGCQTGEIELGMTTSTLVNLQMSVQQVFSETFIQQTIFDELLQWPPPQIAHADTTRVSSSSSSLRSLSVGSPEYSSLINMSIVGQLLSPNPLVSEQVTLPSVQEYSYQNFQNIQRPTPENDDMEMARAMLAVISSSTSSTSFSTEIRETRGSSSSGAFKPYESGLAPKGEPIKASSTGSQRMVKRVLALLRGIYFTRYVPSVHQGAMVQPTSGQLHHVISERKRREKLNDSFDALRKLLPPGSKRDKASLLINTKDYVNALKAQIAELEEKNKNLETQLQSTEQVTSDRQTQEVGESSERIQVTITRPSESTSNSQEVTLQIVLRDHEHDFMSLIFRTVGCLKEIGSFSLVSIDASNEQPRFSRVNLTLQLQVGDYDEESLKEAVKKAIGDANMEPPKAP